MRWSYKTIHYQLKKEGILGSTFLDESEIELSLNQYGKAGWELVSLLETSDGLIAIFKQPLDLDTRSFATPSAGAEKGTRSPRQKEKKVAPVHTSGRLRDVYTPNEEVAEAILLDEFEVEHNKVDEAQAKVTKTTASVTPVDVGKIRIE